MPHNKRLKIPTPLVTEFLVLQWREAIGAQPLFGAVHPEFKWAFHWLQWYLQSALSGWVENKGEVFRQTLSSCWWQIRLKRKSTSYISRLLSPTLVKKILRPSFTDAGCLLVEGIPSNWHKLIPVYKELHWKNHPGCQDQGKVGKASIPATYSRPDFEWK